MSTCISKWHRTAVHGLLGLSCLLGCASGVMAQSMGLADEHAWSAFASLPSEAPRPAKPLDLAFGDIRREGPWATSTAAMPAADVSRLFDLLDQAKWPDALAWLKQTNPDLNRPDTLGRTPLSMAARAGQLALVREMIRQGADVDQRGAGGMTPLGGAALGGHELVVRDLLLAGAELDRPGATGQLPLHLACTTGQVRIVELLLQQGADWRWPNRQGRHAVAEAAYFGQMGVLTALAARDGSSLAAPDVHRLNAVHAAALGGQLNTVDWLRARGVPVPSVLSQVLIDQLTDPVAPR